MLKYISNLTRINNKKTKMDVLKIGTDFSGIGSPEEAETLKLMMDASDADFTVAQLIIDNYESHI